MFKQKGKKKINIEASVNSFFTAVFVYLSTVEHQLILLDKEIESYKKSTTEEQEQNETLTMQLKGSQMDCATYKKLINEKQAQQEALQAHFSTCLRTLKETERTLTRLSTVARTSVLTALLLIHPERCTITVSFCLLFPTVTILLSNFLPLLF